MSILKESSKVLKGEGHPAATEAAVIFCIIKCVKEADFIKY